MKQLGLTAIGAGVLVIVLLFATSQAHAITRAEILEGYTTELKKAYNDPSLNPVATALCQLIARRLHPILPDTSQLDYDLDEKQNEYFEKIAIQLDLDRETRGLVAWRIFQDACKVEAGNYQEPSRWNGWRHDIWSKVRTQQEQVEHENELARLEAERKAKEARQKAERAQRDAKWQAEYEAKQAREKAESKRFEARRAREQAEKEKTQTRCLADYERRKAQYAARSNQCEEKLEFGPERNACYMEAHERFLGKSARKRECRHYR